ncbi:MAG: aminoglycoside phosphotransferase family protein, partial [Spirochaetaceae bacterium]
MSDNTPVIDERTAGRIFADHFPDPIARVTRFPTGLCHYVYEVITSDGTSYVVRIASRATRAHMEGGLYWAGRLRESGVPVPEVYAAWTDDPLSYTVMERLPGTDLGHVYATMSSSAKRDLAVQIATIQQTVGSWPKPRRYGFAFSYEHVESDGAASWCDVVEADIARSESRIREVGRIDTTFIERVREIVAENARYFAATPPTPFLDDTTTKNVIVDDGVLSGIVDTDQVCFGDPFFTIGLTKMALLSAGHDTEYIEYWLAAIGADAEARRIVDVYTLVFCLNFMSELGQTFNREIVYDKVAAARFADVFAVISARIERDGR